MMAAAASYRPFTGHHDFADLLRLLVCGAGLVLLSFIARAVVEGVRHHDMDFGQSCRFAALAVLDVSASLGSAERFGVSLNWHVIANLVGLLFAWGGVVAVRHEQRRITGGIR